MRDDALIKCGVWGAIAVVALLIAPGKLSSRLPVTLVV